MWFICALLTALSWGAANLFYKTGTDPEDRYSHLKIVVMVGLVMGAHAIIYMLVKGIVFNPMYILTYSPVSILYILAMVAGYIGLRYLELSIISPVQNSSGALAALLCFIFFTHVLSGWEIGGIVAITIGIVGLAVVEKKEEEAALKAAGTVVDRKYQLGFLAIVFPLLYCLLDGVGTFVDAIYLDEMALISEDNALLAYEFTFLICAVGALVFLRVKKEKFFIFKERDKGLAALLETAGQFFYVYAMADNAIIAAPMIASYCIFSVILARIFLKERLRPSQNAAVAVVIVGIVLLGISEGL